MILEKNIILIKAVIRIFSLIFFLIMKSMSVFSNEWILTASHCVDGTNAAEIQVGYFFGKSSIKVS